jgi:hypothetical protein
LLTGSASGFYRSRNDNVLLSKVSGFYRLCQILVCHCHSANPTPLSNVHRYVSGANIPSYCCCASRSQGYGIGGLRGEERAWYVWLFSYFISSLVLLCLLWPRCNVLRPFFPNSGLTLFFFSLVHRGRWTVYLFDILYSSVFLCFCVSQCIVQRVFFCSASLLSVFPLTTTLPPNPLRHYPLATLPGSWQY